MLFILGNHFRFLAGAAVLAIFILAVMAFRTDTVFSVPAQNERDIRKGSDAKVDRPDEKIAPAVLLNIADGKLTPVVILLDKQADTSAAREINDWDQRGWYVYNTLKSHADHTQAGMRALLDSRGIAYKPFWAANMIAADLDAQTIVEIADRADVSRIDSNLPTRWIEEPEIEKGDAAPGQMTSPNAIEWGVTNVNAPTVWGLGFKGQGIVIGDLDTGVRWTHDSIKGKYRGWNGTAVDHNYNWWDAVHSGGGVCGANTVAPCDDNGHGTHTVGTILGDDENGNQIGVAPDAKWIGCRNMNVGNGTPATYTECFQFMIAPTDSAGNNPNPSRRPHILNNSWSCPPSEGCTTGGELETIIKNTQDAGIFVVASAGNSGPTCGQMNAPGMYNESFSVGATDVNNMLASFSTRGPSPFYDPVVSKPNISAPGVNVRSAVSSGDNSYGFKSGTSMAGPHVAGVIALLFSARPGLIGDIETTRELLQDTANPNVSLTSPQTCGGIESTQVPNNSFGHGRVDALATLDMGFSGRTITPEGNGLRNTIVTIKGADGLSQTTRSSSFGFFAFDKVYLGGSYTILVTSKRYRFSPLNILVSENMNSPDLVGQE